MRGLDEGHIRGDGMEEAELKPRESSSATMAEGGATQSAKAPESEGRRRAAATAGESLAERNKNPKLIFF